MPMYAIASIPFLNSISTVNTKHAAYADDLSCAGKLEHLLEWWNSVNEVGSRIGYFPKASKTDWLIIKPEKINLAKTIFGETGINITTEEKRHLGAAIGSRSYKETYVLDKVDEWVRELSILSKIATFYPQSAYCA